MDKNDILPDGSLRQYDTGYPEIRRPIDLHVFWSGREDKSKLKQPQDPDSIEPMEISLDEKEHFINGYWSKIDPSRLKQMVKVSLFCPEESFIIEELQDRKKLERWIEIRREKALR